MSPVNFMTLNCHHSPSGEVHELKGDILEVEWTKRGLGFQNSSLAIIDCIFFFFF